MEMEVKMNMTRLLGRVGVLRTKNTSYALLIFAFQVFHSSTDVSEDAT